MLFRILVRRGERFYGSQYQGRHRLLLLRIDNYILSFAATTACCLVQQSTCFSTSTEPSSALSVIDDSQYPATMPQPPHSYQCSRSSLVDLSRLAEKAKLREARRQEAFEFSRRMQLALMKAQDAVWKSSADGQEAMDALDTLIQSEPMALPPSISSNGSDTGDRLRAPREANLSMRMEDYVRLKAFRHFLVTATLLPPPNTATDEEYLAGACMGLAQDLQRYGLGRATVRDAESIEAASYLVSDILDYLLQLDFRNGPLRRKYDGTKYSLKALETLLYELSITSGVVQESRQGRKSKRSKQESSLLPNDDLVGIKQRMERRDNLREQIIKLSRDAQKSAKQAIFALHRGDYSRAVFLIESCESCVINDLLPIVREEPNLRQGSFTAVIEEYIEARLFCKWLGSDPTTPTGEIISETGFVVDLEPEEYIGGLCDLTGEVGRFAVQRGTVRDFEAVQLCLQTNQAILTALNMMESWPWGTGKKLDVVRTSVDKLQRMLYEMSLSEAAGGRNVKSDVEMEDPNTLVSEDS